jgi:hypothetical protein
MLGSPKYYVPGTLGYEATIADWMAKLRGGPKE